MRTPEWAALPRSGCPVAIAVTSVRPLVAITGAWNVAPAKPKPIKPILSNDDMAIPGCVRNERMARRVGAGTTGYFGMARRPASPGPAECPSADGRRQTADGRRQTASGKRQAASGKRQPRRRGRHSPCLCGRHCCGCGAATGRPLSRAVTQQLAAAPPRRRPARPKPRRPPRPDGSRRRPSGRARTTARRAGTCSSAAAPPIRPAPR